MKKIGITGGIGSGKSYVCKRLQAKYDIEVYDCDAAAKRLIRTSPDLQQQIIQLVGSLDKAAMSRFLLASEANQQAMNANHDAVLVTNLRHYEALKHASESLHAVSKGLEDGIPTDLVAQDLREALYYLGSITGEITTEEVLGSIFGRFCIGK